MSLFAVAAHCAREWGVELEETLATPRSLVAFARDAVVKVQIPDRESEHEAAALHAWNGVGAVRLLAHDEQRHALLLERCRPGTPLSQLPQDAALDVLTGLLPRLWRPVGSPFRPLAEEAAWWQESLPRNWRAFGKPFERSLLDAALATLRELAASQGEQVLLHQDLHADNVLRAEREPWLVVDPKPLAGEREAGLAPIVRSFELGGTRRDMLHRLDRLPAELALDRERVRGWAFAQTLAWSFDSEYHASHVDTARWLLQA
jgi:streptomycin 6-kinase